MLCDICKPTHTSSAGISRPDSKGCSHDCSISTSQFTKYNSRRARLLFRSCRRSRLCFYSMTLWFTSMQPMTDLRHIANSLSIHWPPKELGCTTNIRLAFKLQRGHISGMWYNFSCLPLWARSTYPLDPENGNGAYFSLWRFATIGM
jgi:hypothetical protein